ncbi:MAG TPA: hypothetical protein ENK21_04420, partial [Trueperaceae bacterium]|nr:hypothetical protein [Trueperaceae bacterium]
MTKIPKTMRALVLSGQGFDNLAIREVPVAKPRAKQLLARVDAASICTSLVKLIEQGSKHSYLYGWDTQKYPIILGDEGSVTIVEVGSDLKNDYKVGQRFVVQPSVDISPINHRERYENVDLVNKVAVSYTLPGHLAEYILISEETIQAGCLLPITDKSIPYAHASNAEPISCCLSGQEHHLHLQQDRTVAERKIYKGLKQGGFTVIVGAGAMGRMHIDIAMSYLPKVILVVDFIGDRLERSQQLFAKKAQKLGISLVLINPKNQDIIKAILKLNNNKLADDVIVAVGSAKAIESSQYYLARYGVLNLFGGLKKGEDIVKLDAGIIHYKEINVTGSSGGSPWDLAKTLEL